MYDNIELGQIYGQARRNGCSVTIFYSFQMKFCYVACNSSECVWFYLFAQLEGFSLHNSTFDINILLFNDHSKPDGCFLLEKYNSKKQTESKSNYTFPSDFMIQCILDLFCPKYCGMSYGFN